MKCECENHTMGCQKPYPYDKDFRCSRDLNHIGKHYACSDIQHKVYEWENK